jgi:hypothetical protein
VVRELFFENNQEKLKEYHGLLADYYQYHSINRKISCQRLCYHLPLIDDNERFYKFLKSRECLENMSNYKRSGHLNVILLF